MSVRAFRFGVAPLIAAAVLVCSQPAAAQELWLETYRHGDAVVVWAEARLSVDPRVAWEVLSDYDHLSRFIPDLSDSRVVSRSNGKVLVEQKGEFAFLFFHRAIELRLEITETPRSRIVARAISGSFSEMAGRYDLEADGDGVRVLYAGRFVPRFALPPLLGMIALRHTAATQFEAMVREMQRRDALVRARAGPTG